MTITQALSLRPGTRVIKLTTDGNLAYTGRVTSNGRRVWIEWNEHGEQVFDHRFMHYIHVPADPPFAPRG